MSVSSPEIKPDDYVQQSIEFQLDRLSTRMRQNKLQDREIIHISESTWIAYLEPATVRGTIEDAIYFMDVDSVRTAYSIVWTNPSSAKVYGADRYENIVNSVGVFFGFDLAQGTEWQLLKSSEAELPVSELLEALPA